MYLSDLKINQEATIINISSNEELKQRFYSFGINKGSIVKVEAISPTKNTLEINVEDTFIALRVEEAKTIEVKVD